MASITTAELARLVDDSDKAPFVFDVRAPEAFDRWQIEGKVELPTLNVPYWTAITEDDEVKPQLPTDRDVVVVCAHGGSSDLVVETLDMPNLRNLEGGMDAWANTLVPHTLWDDGTHFVIQFDRIAKACLSYAVGARNGTMAVIDPAGEIEPYLQLGKDMQAELTDIFDTHLHADHISLARALRDATGATYHISEGDAEGASYEYTALVDGETFTFGQMDLIVRSVATPGHTPGSTSLEVAGRFLMTGDAVFVSGIGRPDLGGQTDPWARDLFHTIHDKLAMLDHGLQVAPAHYTSRSESNDDGTLLRRLGDLLEHDPVVSMTDEEAFVEHVVTHLGEAPAIYQDIRQVNMGWKEVDDDEAKELEVGRNECALSK